MIHFSSEIILVEANQCRWGSESRTYNSHKRWDRRVKYVAKLGLLVRIELYSDDLEDITQEPCNLNSLQLDTGVLYYIYIKGNNTTAIYLPRLRDILHLNVLDRQIYNLYI